MPDKSCGPESTAWKRMSVKELFAARGTHSRHHPLAIRLVSQDVASAEVSVQPSSTKDTSDRHDPMAAKFAFSVEVV